MSPGTLILRGLRHYWRTNLAVVAGVAIAVSVLAGALLVGESVRASLRGLVDERLGRTAIAVTGQGFFRQVLGDEIKRADGFSTQFADAATLVAIEASVTHEPSGREASRVQVYGVDASFFRLHGVTGVEAPTGRQALLSPGLAAELGAATDDGLLLRVQKPSAIPANTLAGRRSDTSRAVRLTTRETLAPDRMGEFTLRPQQEAVRAIFVPIARLQRDLELAGRANVLLLSARSDGADAAVAERLLSAVATFEDLGLRLVPAEAQHAWVLESEAGLLSDSLVSTARSLTRRLGFVDMRVLTYLANTIRIGERDVPYSVVGGVDPRQYRPGGRWPQPPAPTGLPRMAHPPIWLNAWAAADLQARAGDEVTLDVLPLVGRRTA